jgi:hypothetical protein
MHVFVSKLTLLLSRCGAGCFAGLPETEAALSAAATPACMPN